VTLDAVDNLTVDNSSCEGIDSGTPLATCARNSERHDHALVLVVGLLIDGFLATLRPCRISFCNASKRPRCPKQHGNRPALLC